MTEQVVMNVCRNNDGTLGFWVTSTSEFTFRTVGEWTPEQVVARINIDSGYALELADSLRDYSLVCKKTEHILSGVDFSEAYKHTFKEGDGNG